MIKKIIVFIFYTKVLFSLTDTEKELFHLIENNSSESELREIFKYKLNFNSTNDDGLTPLFYAIKYTNEIAVRVLLNYKEVNIDYTLENDYKENYKNITINLKGATPIEYAIFKNNSSITRLLLNKNANIKHRDINDLNSFLYASAFASPNIIRMLLYKDRTLATDRLSNGLNALHIATIFDNTDNINFLVRNVAFNINDVDYENKTALFYASTYQNKASYDLLLSLGANKDTEYISNSSDTNNIFNFSQSSFNDRVVYDYIYNSDIDLLKNTLLYSNVNINNYTRFDITPLLYAINISNNIAIKTLLDFYKDIDINKSFNTNIIEDFDSFKLNINGISPINYSVLKNNFYAFKLLIDNGADYRKKDTNYYNTFLYASLSSNYEIIKFLLDKDKNSYRVVDNLGNNPMHLLAQFGDIDTFILIHKNTPININSQNVNGDTPLHLSVIRNNKEVFRYLLINGANYNIKNYDGKSVKDIIKNKKEFESIVIELEELNLYTNEN